MTNAQFGNQCPSGLVPVVGKVSFYVESDDRILIMDLYIGDTPSGVMVQSCFVPKADNIAGTTETYLCDGRVDEGATQYELMRNQLCGI